MKSKIATGIWLIFFGIIALLHNFNVIAFNFYAIIKYWPLLIISIGINLIFQYKNYGTVMIIALNVAICAFLAYTGYTSTDKFSVLDKIVVVNNTQIDTKNTSTVAHVPFSADITNPEFTFNIGAAAVQIDSMTTELIEAKSSSKNLNFNLESNSNQIELNAVVNNKSSKSQIVNLALNTKPIWDLIFNVGASKFQADLMHHRISSMELNAGAATINLKLGEPAQEEAKLEINTAASNCIISIPKDAACAVEMATILSSNKLTGFTKKDDLWQTENYETATKKYIIEINGAANSLKIDRY